MFEAWTNPKIVMKWFGRKPNSLHSATIDLRIGGRWLFIKSIENKKSIGFNGQYLDILPNEKLIFTWAQVVIHHNGEREVSPYSRVEVIFNTEGSGTFVCLVHSALPNTEASKGFGGGWEHAFNTINLLFSDTPNNY